MANSVPQVLVFQEFNAVPSEITDPLRAHISGPHAYLLRYSEASEKVLGDLGGYDPVNGLADTWPQRPVGAIVDEAYTKIFIDGARLEYFSDLIASDDLVAPVANKPNRVRIADATYGFKANTGHPRFPLLYDRDVQPGDTVHIRGVADSVTYTLDSYVLALAADPTAAVTGAASADAANGGTHSAAAVVTQVAGDENCNTLVASVTGYVSYGDGDLVDTYTVTVVDSSVDGDLQTATLRVTTASGRDDVLSVGPGTIDDFFDVGHRGLQLKFTCASHANASLSTDDLVAGQQWTVDVTDDYKAIAGTSGGTYTGAKDALYIVKVTRGALFADDHPPQVTVTTTTGVDVSGPTEVSGVGVAVAVGSRGLTVTFSGSGGPTGLRKGDTFYIPATASKDGRFGTLVLGHNLPEAIQDATDLDLRLSITKDIQVTAHRDGFEPETNWDQSATEVTVNSGIIAYDPTFTDGGVPVAIPVVGGGVFVEYRAWRQELTGDVGSIDDVGLLNAQIPGPLTPDNPLKWGVYYALLNSNGTLVKYTAVADPSSVDDWTDTLSLLVGREDVYNLVPLTHDATVLNLYSAHCSDQSSPENGRWRAMFLNLQAVVQKAVVSPATTADGEPALATVADDPDTSGTQYTLLTIPGGNGQLLRNGTRPGDIARIQYSTSWGEDTWVEYPVDAVISEDSLRLASGPDSAITVASRVEIWHPLTKDEQAADVGRRAGSYGSRRVKAVWPDQISSGGTPMDGYFLCCALAGLRSGVVPHQGLTNLAIHGFDDVSRTTSYFNANQLNIMANDGVWVVTQDPDGVVKTRQALTTDLSDINHQSEMVTANLDSISYLFLHRLQPFIGVTNVTPTAIARLHVELVSAIEYLKANGFTETLGSQLIDATIVDLRPHALLRDRVVGIINVTLPYELNYLELHLVV